MVSTANHQEETMKRKHLILMIVGCSLPIVALAAVFVFQVKLSTPLLFALLLLCPLSHLFMLGGHNHSRQQTTPPSHEEHLHG
jgi:hypothetical protein|nr:hypothetical protein [uncultured bacterium]